MRTDRKDKKLMVKVSKRIKYDVICTGEGQYNDTHDMSVYEVDYPDWTREQLTANIIAENIISHV